MADNNSQQTSPLDDFAKIQFLVDKEINDKITDYAKQATLTVAQIPTHTHNGVDSLKVSFTDLNIPLNTINSIRPIHSGTFASGSTTYTQTDSTVTASSIIDVYAQATPVGTWSVSSSAGSFTITSTATESANVAFKYFINNF